MSFTGRPESAAARLRTQLSDSGRFSGTGILYDNYDDEALGGGHIPDHYKRRMKSTYPEQGKEWEALNGPVIITNPGEKNTTEVI